MTRKVKQIGKILKKKIMPSVGLEENVLFHNMCW